MELVKWKMFEGEESYQKYIKDNYGEEALEAYFWRNHPDRKLETDKSDVYLGAHGKPFVSPEITGHTSIEVLNHLIGKHSEIYGNYSDEKDFTVVKTLNYDDLELLKKAFKLIESPIKLDILEAEFDHKTADYDAPTVTLYGYNPCDVCSYQDGSDYEED